jgi:hypothetical protein
MAFIKRLFNQTAADTAGCSNYQKIHHHSLSDLTTRPNDHPGILSLLSYSSECGNP